jgi:predicted metallopeptidase
VNTSKKEYTYSPEAERIGRDLINDYHTHLSTCRVEFVFVSETPVAKGKEVWGRARKITGINAFLGAKDDPEDYFVIELARPIWNRLDDKQKRALVDHELCHCDRNEETGGLIMVSHDVEEFSGVIVRHGLWRHDVQHFVELGAQMHQRGLFDDLERRADKAIAQMDAQIAKRNAEAVPDETTGPNGEPMQKLGTLTLRGTKVTISGPKAESIKEAAIRLATEAGTDPAPEIEAKAESDEEWQASKCGECGALDGAHAINCALHPDFELKSSHKPRKGNSRATTSA